MRNERDWDKWDQDQLPQSSWPISGVEGNLDICAFSERKGCPLGIG